MPVQRRGLGRYAVVIRVRHAIGGLQRRRAGDDVGQRRCIEAIAEEVLAIGPCLDIEPCGHGDPQQHPRDLAVPAA
jgi:hypothetical protein